MNCPSCGVEVPSGDRSCRSCGTDLVMPSSSGETHTASGFVGRQRELLQLTNALEDALSGKGRLVMLAGEPGIGKTRIAQELAAYAETRGAEVLWGWCYEEGGAPPYWPWVQVLQSYVQTQGPEQLQAVLGPRADSIAELLPVVRERLPGIDSSQALEPEQAQFRLFDSIARLLHNVSQMRPLILVLDDLHWADRSSLLLLEFVAREIDSSPMLVLGTYRDTEVSRRHPLAQTLGGLIRDQRFLRVPLGGLSLQEVGEWTYRITGTTPPLELVKTVHGRTEGNPLFLGEVVRMLTREGPSSWQERVTHIPEGVKEALARNFNHLSEECNQLMTTASVIGREFEFRLLQLLSRPLSEEGLLTLVEEALEDHVLVQGSPSTEVYRFAHALIQETLQSELSPSRRVRLHARVGEALEQLYAADLASHASQLAHHFAQAAPVLGSEKLVRYSGLAGEQALSTYAWEEALAHFERGLTARAVALEGTEPAGDAETADLLFGLAKAKLATRGEDQVMETFAILRRAFEHYAEVGNIVPTQ